jgi:phosphate uptake regulator
MLGILRDLFRADDAVARMGEGFDDMLGQAREIVLMAGRHYFDGPPSPEDRTALVALDLKLNRRERKIRKRVVSHLALNGGADAVYGLLLMSLVKDVERIGDYAKNLSEVYDGGGGRLPQGDDPNLAELKGLRHTAEDLLADVARVFSESDSEAAPALIERGVAATRRADGMLRTVASGPYDAATAVTLILGARYYKRIIAHVVNVLTGVVMPIHKLDYYDEDELDRLKEAAGDGDDGEQ